MNVSVIIPTRNAEKYINNLIINLKNQTIRPKEIIVIDTNINIEHPETLKENSKVIISSLNNYEAIKNRKNFGEEEINGFGQYELYLGGL